MAMSIGGLTKSLKRKLRERLYKRLYLWYFEEIPDDHTLEYLSLSRYVDAYSLAHAEAVAKEVIPHIQNYANVIGEEPPLHGPHLLTII
jgi:hypothetical protein